MHYSERLSVRIHDKCIFRVMFALAKTAIRSPCWGCPSLTILSGLQLRNRHIHTTLSTSVYKHLSVRRHQSLAPKSTKASSPTRLQPPAPPSGYNESENPTQAEQRKKDWRIMWRLMANVWPKNDWNTRGRVLFGLGLLVGGKVDTFSREILPYVTAE